MPDTSIVRKSEVRGRMPQDRQQIRIGLSTHAPAQAKRAVDAGADYIAIGTDFCDRHKADSEAGDARLCALGGGERKGAMVRDWRNQFAKH